VLPARYFEEYMRPQAPKNLPQTTPAKTETDKQFIAAMREQGWIEGRNIVYDRMYADDDFARLPSLAAALVARGPDLIHTSSNLPTLAALAKTRSIPIVFSASNDPVENGIVKSLAHSGGNVTGVANIGFELGGKRLQLLKQALPKVSRQDFERHEARRHSGRVADPVRTGRESEHREDARYQDSGRDHAAGDTGD
jgi:hypothetical protein